MKHADDGGEIETFVDDSGEILYVCTLCKKKWLGRSEPMRMTQLERAKVTMAIRANPRILEDSPLDIHDIL